MSRSEVDEQNISVEICSVKIMQMRSLSSLRTIRGVRADNTFLGGKKLPLTWSSVDLLAGQEEQQAKEPRGWLQAAVSELGGALAWWASGRTPAALLRCCAAAPLHRCAAGGSARRGPEGRGGSPWAAVSGHRWCFLHPRLLYRAQVLNKVDKAGHSQIYCW